MHGRISKTQKTVTKETIMDILEKKLERLSRGEVNTDRLYPFLGFVVGATLMYRGKDFFKRSIILLRHRSIVGNPKTSPKMVIVVRRDVDMSTGKLASQVSHAAVSCYSASVKYNKAVTDLWETTGQPKVVVKCDKPGESEIFELAAKANKLNLITAVIKDAGKTEVEPETVTALGIGPGMADLVDKVSGHLRLLK